MLCLNLWTRLTHLLKLLTSVVCLHLALVVFLEREQVSRYVTFTTLTTAVSVLLKLLKVQISVNYTIDNDDVAIIEDILKLSETERAQKLVEYPLADANYDGKITED